MGYPLDGSSAGALQASFDGIKNEDIKSVLTVLAIKPMQRAKYFCTGALDASMFRHYALNVPLYTHFTSPIRRYADVIVHRQLDAALKEKGKEHEKILSATLSKVVLTLCPESSGYTKKTAMQIANDCNRKRDGAKNAQEANIQLYLARYLDNLEAAEGPIIRSAVVVNVLSEAYDILVPEYDIEARIRTKQLPLERLEFSASGLALSLYWKKDVLTNMDYNTMLEDLDNDNEEEENEQDETESTNTEGSRLYVEDEDIDDPPLPGRPVAKVADIDGRFAQELDLKTGMQRIKVFSKIDVVIRVNAQRSPPFINVYPLNPFADRPSKDLIMKLRDSADSSSS